MIASCTQPTVWCIHSQPFQRGLDQCQAGVEDYYLDGICTACYTARESAELSSSKEERFQEFLSRLLATESVDSEAAAVALITKTLTCVEDEMTDLPNKPANWQTDGRMYPPQMDQSRNVDSRPDLVRYRSRGHNTFFRDNGAIEIQDLEGHVLLSKPGKDGRGVDYEQE